MRLEELPYIADSAALFLPWANRKWAVVLDSAHPFTHQGRYDIISAEPYKTLITRGSVTEIREGSNVCLSPKDPFSLVKDALGEPSRQQHGLPFSGGAIGFFGYDLARRLEKIPEWNSGSDGIPDMMVGLYSWAVVVDHQEKKSFLVGDCSKPGLESRWPHLVTAFSQIQIIGWQQNEFSVLSSPRANLTRSEYQKAFDRIQNYIHEGDCYQVNLAMRFSSFCAGDPWMAYQWLRSTNPSPFGAYLNFSPVQVLSSSPERFLSVHNGLIETKPIKGTRPRSLIPSEDKANSEALQQSDKDRAENLMIVDLLRNDISKGSEIGSVNVPKLFDIESFATVHHLVSTIQARLAHNQHALDLLRGCFPGGSITGAPKIRAMEIIEELEPNRRGLYCGSIGYIGFNGNMDSNITIRTLVCSDNSLRFWAGGGIVADSNAELEYEECFHKAAAMLNLMEQFRSEKNEIRSMGC